MAAYHAEYPCDLAKPSQMIAIPHVFAMGDNESHTFTALVYDSSDPECGLMAGSVSGVVVRPDGATVPLTGEKGAEVRTIRTADGQTVQATACTLTMIQGCFAYPGQIVIVIRLVDGESQTAVLVARGTVTRSLTDTTVDPGEIIPDITQLIAEAEQAAADAESALSQATAVVSYAAQSGHSDTEKATARSNIGAASEKDFELVTGTTENILATRAFDGATGITEVEPGHYKGTGAAFFDAFGPNTSGVPGLTFEENAQYYISAKAYREGDSTSTANGLRFRVVYTDDTAGVLFTFTLNTTAFATLGALTTLGKSVKYFQIGYASEGDTVWHVKDVAIIKSYCPVDYIQHETAEDFTARAKLQKMAYPGTDAGAYRLVSLCDGDANDPKVFEDWRHESGVTTLDLSRYAKSYFVLMGAPNTGKFGANGTTYQSIQIPTGRDIKKVYIHANTGSTAYAFAKTRMPNNPANGDSFLEYLSEGETARRELSANREIGRAHV